MASDSSRRHGMRVRRLPLLLLQVAIAFASPASFAAVPCDAYATVDGPALSLPGQYPPGRRSLSFEVPPTGTDELRHTSPRSLTLVIWYPAALDGCESASPYRQVLERHAWRPLPAAQIDIDVPSAATEGAPVSQGQRYPVVVLSHGLLGWGSAFTYLGDHLASRGYVVVAIDHRDDLPGPLDPLKSALAFRSADQLATIAALRRWSSDPQHFLHGRIDTDRIALVGYSMGGFGALQTAGQQDPGLKGVVAIAPWGGQSHVGAIDRSALRTLTVPVLFVAGDHDDVSGFQDGIRSLFQEAAGSNRWLLVYQNARHNVGGYPLPAIANQVLELQPFFVDPVWRIGRIQAVNRHFVTAFLDLMLKADATRRTYLEPPTTRSNDGRWPVENPFDLTDPMADSSAAPGFWPGFRRRSALGLELMHLVPGQSKAPQ
jgi:alpha-beta hydrolase superfamily lysophospholipase